MDCECINWARDNGQIWTNHHPKCINFPEQCKDCIEEFGDPTNCKDCPDNKITNNKKGDKICKG